VDDRQADRKRAREALNDRHGDGNYPARELHRAHGGGAAAFDERGTKLRGRGDRPRSRHATVRLGRRPALPRGDVATLTNADGTYAVSGYDGRGPTYVMVFPPAADRHLSLHARELDGEFLRRLAGLQ
jgi:hypothetical protein